jgi:hypothetical protein
MKGGTIHPAIEIAGILCPSAPFILKRIKNGWNFDAAAAEEAGI